MEKFDWLQAFAAEQQEQPEPGVSADAAPEDVQERAEAFRALIQGPYKKDYDRQVQTIVRERLKNCARSEQVLKSLSPALQKTFGVDAAQLTPEQAERLAACSPEGRVPATPEQREEAMRQGYEALREQFAAVREAYPGAQLHEELEQCGKRLMEYKECFEIMGKDRNSYSKTDLEATFMRMKEDYMLNGQLKPAYNVQIAVENYYIVHGYVSSDRTDYNTLIPVLEKHKNAFGSILEEVTADSGYCSEKNLLYLKRNEISSYIKLQDHEKRKTRAYSEDISKYYNMRTGIFEDEQFYICHDGRELRHLRTESKEQDGYTQTFEVYGCADCSGCEHKARCLYKYDAEKDAEKNKVMKINEQWEELKERSHANIQSERGILKRQTHSIQTEGHFGDIKENENFRRFNYRSADKVYKEFMLYAIGRNINKYHRFLYEKLRKFEGKTA